MYKINFEGHISCLGILCVSFKTGKPGILRLFVLTGRILFTSFFSPRVLIAGARSFQAWTLSGIDPMPDKMNLDPL